MPPGRGISVYDRDVLTDLPRLVDLLRNDGPSFARQLPIIARLPDFLEKDLVERGLDLVVVR